MLMYLPSRTASELHKLSKIKCFRSALRAGRVRKLTSDLLLGTLRKFSAVKVFTKDVIPGYSKQDVRARCEACFSLGASRRNVPLAGPHPSYTRAHYKGTLQGYTTRVHYKGRYKGTLQGSFWKYLWVSPPNNSVFKYKNRVFDFGCRVFIFYFPRLILI